MNGFFKRYGVLITVLLLFILLKLPHLHYAYYWDESWPYASAISDMSRHGLSFMPGAISEELTRGHPLFFHVLAAGWMDVFGSSHVSMHCFALTIAVLLLIAVYEAGLRFFDLRVAIMALLLIATQELFFVQSSFVLLEVLTALLAFLSLCCYISARYVLTTVCLTALFYTKESGLILGFVLGIDALINTFGKDTPRKERAAGLLAIAVPAILIVTFFIVQKNQTGWYIFPVHSEMLVHTWQDFWFKLRMACIRELFYVNYKYCTFLLLMATAVVAAVKTKAWRYLAILLPGVIIYYFINDMRAGRLLPSIPFFIVFTVGTAYFLYAYARSALFATPRQRRFVILSGAFIYFYLCFCAVNFFTNRYLLAAMVPLLFITAALFVQFIERIYKPLFLPVLAATMAVSCLSLCSSYPYGEFAAFAGMDMEQSIADYMQQHVGRNAAISAFSFLERQHLTDAATGYLHSGTAFSNVKWAVDDSTRYIVCTSLEPDDRYSAMKRDTTFVLVYRIAKGDVWGEIYKRR